MAEASISVNHHQFSCPLCLDLLKDPVAIPCGHSFCVVCINGCWDQDEQRGVYSCPQCSERFAPRPDLYRNTIMAEVVEKLKKTQIQADSCHIEPGDVECDLCTDRKRKAIKTCLTCLASFCETHLNPHNEVPALKKHKLVKVCTQLQEKICSEHNRLMEIFCCTDQISVCYLCTMDKHRGHDTVSATTVGTEKQSFQSLCVSSGSEASPSIAVHQHPLFDGVRKSLSELKEPLEEFWKIPPQAASFQILPLEPKTREDFLEYFCHLTLDPNTAHNHLILSEENRVVMRSKEAQPYSDLPERFNVHYQVLSKESVSGRCYWEAEWTSERYAYISVSYKEISRKGGSSKCWFGGNSHSWSLQCYPSLSFFHNGIKTYLSAPPSSRIGVYVDHSAGTLSFYSISDTVTLLYALNTTFTQPVHAGFRVGGTVRLCDKIIN